MAIKKDKFSLVFNASMILVFAVWIILTITSKQYGWTIAAAAAFGLAIYATYDAYRTVKDQQPKTIETPEDVQVEEEKEEDH